MVPTVTNVSLRELMEVEVRHILGEIPTIFSKEGLLQYFYQPLWIYSTKTRDRD